MMFPRLFPTLPLPLNAVPAVVVVRRAESLAKPPADHPIVQPQAQLADLLLDHKPGWQHVPQSKFKNAQLA